MRKSFFLIALLAVPFFGWAQHAKPTDSLAATRPSLPTALAQSLNSLSVGGYFIGQYTLSDQERTKSNGGFNLRLFRLYANGYVAPKLYWRFQMELNDAPGVDKGPRVLDAFVDYRPIPEAQIKLGQFKRAFGFENPMSPLEVGMGSFSQVTLKLQSINDRIGEHRSSGRDLGIQLHGDLFPLSPQHRLLHYQVGLYNGQGINHADLNRHKDLIAGLWVEPLKKLNLGGFVWDGRYTGNTTTVQTLPDGSKQSLSSSITLPRKRYGLGLKYEAAWSVRAEYVHSFGGTLSGGAPKSDGWYALVGAPLPLKGLKLYGRWDAYRDDARTWQGMKNAYTLSANYWAHRNFLVQLGLTHHHDRSLPATADRSYQSLDLQVAARF